MRQPFPTYGSALSAEGRSKVMLKRRRYKFIDAALSVSFTLMTLGLPTEGRGAQHGGKQSRKAAASRYSTFY